VQIGSAPSIEEIRRAMGQSDPEEDPMREPPRIGQMVPNSPRGMGGQRPSPSVAPSSHATTNQTFQSFRSKGSAGSGDSIDKLHQGLLNADPVLLEDLMLRRGSSEQIADLARRGSGYSQATAALAANLGSINAATAKLKQDQKFLQMEQRMKNQGPKSPRAGGKGGKGGAPRPKPKKKEATEPKPIKTVKLHS